MDKKIEIQKEKQDSGLSIYPSDNRGIDLDKETGIQKDWGDARLKKV